MTSTKEKVYKSRKDTAAVLFLVAYILSVAARNEFIPIVFGYIALVPVTINLVLYYLMSKVIRSIDHKKEKRKRTVSLAIGIITNLLVALLILWQ